MQSFYRRTRMIARELQTNMAAGNGKHRDQTATSLHDTHTVTSITFTVKRA